MKKFVRLILCLVVCISVCGCETENQQVMQGTAAPVDDLPAPNAVSLSGAPLFSPKPSSELLEKLKRRKKDFDENSGDADALIWYGRFVAYAGNYAQAIEIFNSGAKQFPRDARMLRHAGHRYISIRQFDDAIRVLEQATALIEGKENEIEPDGMPNAQNIPVSTLHGNIWYHLGLAYYLNQDFDNALRAYKKCLATADRPDNVVSSTHWIYMIHRRLGHEEDAQACLDSIDLEMKIIENTAYHQSCCFYKGLISLEQLQANIESKGLQREATSYAVANWHFYNGETSKARQLMESLTREGAWNAFGFIAAESDLCHAFDDSNDDGEWKASSDGPYKK